MRDISDLLFRLRGGKFAYRHSFESFPTIVKGHFSPILRQLKGVDLQLQRNKEKNLRLAGAQIDGIVIYPGETFSFWRMVGKPTARKGYLPGLTISGSSFLSDIGGGLCQLANLIHWLVLNSPLFVSELHHHSDALFPDERRKVPFGTGTSVFYKNVDYRFLNNTSQPLQLRIWVKDGYLYGELRAQQPFDFFYRIVEEGHHFVQEGDLAYYRCSQIYKETYRREDKTLLCRTLVLDNHSRVMYDPSLIPQDEIWSAQDNKGL